jgi:SAM-dependent methyltransferase
MQPEVKTDQPPICDYEGSDYQERFWGKGERAYEDQVEAIAIRRLLPKKGKLLLEVGAGAGRNTPRYAEFERIVLMDYSSTQLEQAQQRLGTSDRYIYVVADAYSLPFVDGLFDAATMIRVIHHMADAPQALAQVRSVLQPGGRFLLEYANKRNLKAILRYWLGRQDWNPFDRKPVEFVPLNFDFHPGAMNAWLRAAGFAIERKLAISYFRVGWLKRHAPLKLLVGLDALLQPSGAVAQFSPSMFVLARASEESPLAEPGTFFKCPQCQSALQEAKENLITCQSCGRRWGIKNGIYNFKEPIKN